jgi:beta-glucosidase
MKRWLGIGIIAAGLIALAIILPRLFFGRRISEFPVLSQPRSATTRPIEPADIPAPKRAADGSIDAFFWASHLAHLKAAREGNIRVLFLGDSLAYLFPIVGADIWSKNIAPLQAADFAIGGNLTQQVLWQIDNGELDGLHPQVVVLLIGTNNLDDSADNIVRGITRIATEIHSKLPQTHLLLLGILPRDILPDTPFRRKIITVNRQLAQLDDHVTTHFLDIGPAFLAPDGKMRLDATGDGLHLNSIGYQLWLQQMQPLLTQLLAAPQPSSKQNNSSAEY